MKTLGWLLRALARQNGWPKPSRVRLRARCKTVGFVEKASGETEAIVADEGGVYLVPSGGVSLDNTKIPNLLPAEAQSAQESSRLVGGGLPVPGLEISPLMNRALTSPGLFPGIPTVTFGLNVPQPCR